VPDAGFVSLDIPAQRSRDTDSYSTRQRTADFNTSVLTLGEILSTDPYPTPGDVFEGFEVVSELGRGAMGRVYLARQQSPVTRTVVLKIGPRLSSECKKLARLQHSNIVPVYSFHHLGRLQAACMPYRGPLTLAHLVANLRSENLQTLDGKSLTTFIEKCRKDRQQCVSSSVPSTTGQAEAACGGEPLPTTAIPDPPTSLHEGLGGLNYVDAVLTLIRQVVEGLRVAHGERIVHGDLKPANVLIAEDGTAQLIDFGVAFDKADRGVEVRIGGTRPYMSPEQLESFLTLTRAYDERSDLYAVGVMLYELLTGRYPYEQIVDPAPAAIQRDYQNRFITPAPIRSLNAQVPVAVTSIVEKCLSPALEDRYQTAAQLVEDLDRQLTRRPLLYAPNLSTRERAVNWASRHRPLLVGIGCLALTGVGFAGFMQRDARNVGEIRRLEWNAVVEPFVADAEEAEFYFALADRGPEYRDRAGTLSHRALDRFRAGEADDWFLRPEFQGLDPDRQETVRRRAAGLMIVLANLRAQAAECKTDAATRKDLLRQAHEWNRRAELAHPGPDGCRAVWIQRGYLARLGGDPAEAERLARKAEPIPPTSADAFLEGRQYLSEGHTQAALKVLEAAVKADPGNHWAVFYAAVCQQHLEEFARAKAGYDICEALRPDFFGTLFNRGMTRYRLGHVTEAEADFDRVIDSRPDWADAYFQRALAREARKRFVDAIDDLNRSLESGYSPTSVYLIRARVYGRMGNKVAAEREFAEGMKVEPTDERGWMARAQARLFREPVAALADFDQALRVNPTLILALQGKAHLLSKSGKTVEAIQALTRIIELNPDSPDAWSGRGVLRARTGDRDGALADAREALRMTERPATKYQIAGIYGLTSKTHPEDRREAFSLLDGALRAGFGFDLLEKDPELDPIRKDTEFKKIVDAARAYRALLKKADD